MKKDRISGRLRVSAVKNVNGSVCLTAQESRDFDIVIGPVGAGQIVETGIETLRRLGANGCQLVGDPAYYLRFGFRHSQSLTVEHVPPEYFMCLPLAGEIPHGAVTHHPAFYVTG